MPMAISPDTSASLWPLNRLATRRPASMAIMAPAANGTPTCRFIRPAMAVEMTPEADTSVMTARDVATMALVALLSAGTMTKPAPTPSRPERKPAPTPDSVRARMQEAVQTSASTVIQLARRQWLAGSGRVLRLARVRLPEHPQRHTLPVLAPYARCMRDLARSATSNTTMPATMAATKPMAFG